MAARSVVIVGAGQAGSDTAAALRSHGFDGRVTLVGEEPWLPYQRPPLSKAYQAGTVGQEELELRPASFYADQRIELLRGDRAVKIDRELRTLLLDSGRTLPYDALVLATGARPRALPVPGAQRPGVLALRGLDDAEALRQQLAGAERPLQVVVVGAGFIGLEVAATARELGHHPTVVEALPRVLARAVSPVMSDWLAAEHRRRGTALLLRREVVALHGAGTGDGPVQVVELDGGTRLPADLVVVGIGVLPNVGLAVEAGLNVGDGVLVDEQLRTSDPAIHAVGDCARFPSVHAGRPLRLESVQNASDQARTVAAVICGEPAPYRALPWFWSQQFTLRLQIAGITAGHDEAVTAGDPEQGRFSVFCFRHGRLVGVESVNRPADHGIARRLLAAGPDLTPEEVAAPGFDLKRRTAQPV
ncbi:NAD(P)/FAD-dependent oxidoreductase [Streptacidiphilus griseoplanus]|uniref:NAD(P)/FAD-dependent oxidoreductase n=1 Tax=Peterkaempfera griseoplana TaxID=66896 RepID=UPI0006E3EF37|nr:FAD-dependent oxidoreductase [Peterkaempfera griseoplana]